MLLSYSYESDSIIIENGLYSKHFVFNSATAGSIVVDVRINNTGKSVASTKRRPYFEFVINKEIVSSNDRLWIFKTASTRKMGNGGTEHSILFEGVEDPVAGLQVQILQQSFGESTLIREKLLLLTEKNSFELNKLNGNLHFRFPVYEVSGNGGKVVEGTEVRIASFNKRPITFGDKKKANHMYYPDINRFEITDQVTSVKGPISIVSNGDLSWITTYEHASQDDLTGLFKKDQVQQEGDFVNDAMQGVKGVFEFPLARDDFKFLGISTLLSGNNIHVFVEMIRGGYLDGEVIDGDHSYSTVWTSSAFYEGNDLEDGKEILRHYLLNQICENPASRRPEFYYNTWGMQRNDRKKPLRGILTYDRIFEEINYAADLGVDIFVLDDGWENAQGEWYPHKKRLSDGLSPIKDKLDTLGIKMGLWYSPMGIDSTTDRYLEHQNWVIRDSEGNPIMAQWDHPAFDFVSDFFYLFIDDCKSMIDAGCRFMKWDAINTFYSNLPNLHHGSEAYPEEEIRARYEYLLPIYVVEAMRILTEYEPELVIEIDLTEARRVMVGLAPLSYGKFFWMNNGASSYNDYSTYRSKSMRTIVNEFAGLVPLELFTFANYPHDITGNMKYNVHNSMLAGHGFWGNLQLMNSGDRKWIGDQVVQSKKVLPYLVDVNPIITGAVGDSPEIYKIVNKNEAAGQIIAFTSKPVEKEVVVEMECQKMLVALNSQYSIVNDELTISLELDNEDSSVAVIILPNMDKGVTISSTTSPISSAEVNNSRLTYHVAEPGTQTVLIDKKVGKPKVISTNTLIVDDRTIDSFYQVTVETSMGDSDIVIEFQN